MEKQNIYLGVDIGATKTIFLLVKIDGVKYKILENIKVATPKKEKEILKMVEDNYFKLAEKYQPKADKPRAYKIKGVGIGFAGPVDFKRGIAIKGPRLGTGKIYFKKVLEAKLKIKVVVDNDVKCFLFAESVFGKARNYKNFVALTIGTGIGGAVSIGGKLYRGINNFAGEFGHTFITEDRKFEELASGTGLTNVYRDIEDKDLDSYTIVDLARRKDFVALKAIDKLSEFLGTGIVNILLSFDPEIIILGGGMAEVGIIINKAKQYVKKKIVISSLTKTPIEVSKLGQLAVALGAAWISQDNKKNGH